MNAPHPMRWRWWIGAAGLTAVALLAVAQHALAAEPELVRLSVRFYDRDATTVTLAGDPDLDFICASFPSGRKDRFAYDCTAQVPRGATVRLTARQQVGTKAGVSVGSLPIAGRRWRGACAGTRGDVCRLTVTRDGTIVRLRLPKP